MASLFQLLITLTLTIWVRIPLSMWSYYLSLLQRSSIARRLSLCFLILVTGMTLFVVLAKQGFLPDFVPPLLDHGMRNLYQWGLSHPN
jgi:hypothetical protein